LESLFPSRASGSNTNEDEASILGGAFGVYDEGGGVFALYVTPIDAACLGRALDRLELGGALVDVTPERGDGTREVHRASLAEMGEPLELVHAPSLAEGPHEAMNLLAGPHAVLGDGCAFGFSLQDRDHGVVYTRDRRVLAAVLEVWLVEVVDTLAAPGNSPSIPEQTLDSVLAPIPPQAWRRVMLDRHSKYWALDVSALVHDGEASEVIDDLTWVGGPGRAWRAGWSW